MLIISKKNKKDYYDGVVGSMGIDKSIVFERHEKVYEKSDVYFPDEFKNNTWDEINPFHDINFLSFKFNEDEVKIKPFIVFFCGKTHIGWKKFTKNNNHLYVNFDTEITYDTNYIIENNKHVGWRMDIDQIYKKISNYDPIDLHRKYNTPILMLDYSSKTSFYSNLHNNSINFIINPTLKKYEFYKVFDSFLAFQEIQMYISGVLGSNENDTIEVDDKYKIGQHGFDKWSFRKEPTKKK